jgi:hypothetical protein
MVQCIATDADRATAKADSVEKQVEVTLDWLRPRLLEVARAIRFGSLTPTTFFPVELQLLVLLRNFGRFFLERLLNAREGDGRLLPHHVMYEGQGYRRLRKKTRNAYVATLFGTICLWRFGYRFWDSSIKEACIFPLEQQLGLVAGVTPALADYVGRRMAEAGATQNRVLQQLKEEHGVSMGVKRLRELVRALNEGMAEHRQSAQVEVLLKALETAQASSGNRKPVLAVGRDGITLCEYTHRCWEVATTATITVFDRAGKRLTTVYLAYRPELGQAAMSQMITGLLTELFERWEGPLPTLGYVADSGGQETSYFEDVLARMRHPRTRQRLSWQRVVDYYHASQRIWQMAEALFTKSDPRYAPWARRMLRMLKRNRGGIKRVLHSAAAHRPREKLSAERTKEFWKAYNYLRYRTKWLRYTEYSARHIPIGSGITEAACKTIFTERLKLSGMRWKRDGAQHILDLRSALLSHAWQDTYARSLKTRDASIPTPYVTHGRKTAKLAA